MDKKNVHDRSFCETHMDTYMDKKSVHVLFCDCNTPTSTEILALLQECSYKVTAVKSARQVVEALKVKGADVDILLTDVELPREKGFKMLKHISRQDNLSHIAIVVMSEQDEMSVVAKCLLLGAVDYLVKPLRLNEVMNLWTHTWRRRRVLELPDKQEVVEERNLSTSLPNPDTTIDFLSSYKERGGARIAIDTGPCKNPMDREAPHLELSLRISLTYDEEKRNDEVSVPSHNPPAKQKIGNRSAFSLYPKVKKHQQPDEHSGNMSSSSSPISKRARFSNENCIDHNREVTGEHPVMADACSDSPTKDFSMADENRPGDTESQVCEAEPHQPPMQCGTLEERMDNVRDVAVKRMFNLQQPPLSFIHAYHPGLLESHSTDFGQGFIVNTEGVSPTGKYIKPMPQSSQTLLQHLPPLHREAGQNMYSYYHVTHLAVPVMGFSTWQTMIPSPPMVGGKATQAQIREAALSKFRMKRKDRCFEKKIRYASRKKVAEQRPRIRGQFVKRTALIGALGNPVHGSGCNEEGGADDEQGCSELDDNSSPEFI